MIHRKNNMDYEEYDNFIDIETNTFNCFPDNLKSMNEKYNIRSLNKNHFKYKKFNKYHINVKVNIMTTIPEINEYDNHITKKCFDKNKNKNKNNVLNKKSQYVFIVIVLLFVICLKCYYFLHNFV